MNAHAVIRLNDNRFITEIFQYHPQIAYVAEALRTAIPEIEITGVTSDESLRKVYNRYGIKPLQDDLMPAVGEPLIIVDGLAPTMSSMTWKNCLSIKRSTSIIDAFGNEIAQVNFGSNPGSEQLVLEPGEGFAIDSDAKLFMSNGLLSESLISADQPFIRNDDYKIEAIISGAKPKMLFTAPYEFFPQHLKEKLSDNFDITFAYKAPAHEVKQLLSEIEIWVVSTSPPYYMDASFFELAPGLKMVATPSTGTNHLDATYLVEHGVGLVSIKESAVIEDISASSEFSLTLLLMMLRKANRVVEAAPDGIGREFEREFRSIECQGKTIGLIGMGRIGRRMMKYANALDMRVLYFDPNVDLKTDLAERIDDRDDLLKQSDVVSLHYHLDAETENSFTSVDFKLMKNGAYFLNTARGELVDETAMIDALNSGKLAGAAVDVITKEYLTQKRDHPVIRYARENDNLILAPHVAGLTIDSESKAMEDLLNQILTILWLMRCLSFFKLGWSLLDFRERR